MSVPTRPRQRRSAKGGRSSPVAFPVILLVTAAGAAAVGVFAPQDSRTWVLATAVVAWCCVAVVVGTASYLVRRAHRQAVAQGSELEMSESVWRQQVSERSHLVNTTMPGVAEKVKNGAEAEEALSRFPVPSDPHLRQLSQVFATVLAESVRRATAAESDRQHLRSELDRGKAELERLAEETLPAAVELLREGSSADTALAKVDWPQSTLLRELAEWVVRELAYSERRSAAAQAASAKALSRVQAKTVSMLADLREMQDRHGEEVFGDLLRLDHSTSQLGLMTDRLALLMGGRSSRVWNKPIVMESILRGAVGRIAAYRRVRLHSSSKAAINGFAAEGVMHLLAELMDNAANFSPPIDEVHVYVEERSAGIVVTIEDSGLKMSDAAMRRAEESVSGKVVDLAALQGTRLGLGVVGRLAVKYGISVNYRPSSRGGTGVVVLLPPQMVAQQREPIVSEPLRGGTSAPSVPAPAAEPPVIRPQSVAPAEGGPAPRADIPSRPAGAATGGLPLRTPGRTMAEAERERRKQAPQTPAEPGEPGPARDAGSRFGAFHRGRRSAGGAQGGEDTGHASTDD
ncbi:ATP-binding protein [Streptomyces sp. NPDC004166]|uniref:ATP-binding protein n=1 Tax=Streptomyces sp. NPDC093269 TaxID=3366038 RepID=UPI0037F37433